MKEKYGLKTTAIAHANIALIKYWGKRDEALNLPATGSLSITLDALRTRTTVSPAETGNDSLLLNGKTATEAQRGRISAFLDLFRTIAGSKQAFRVESENNFPTGAGLASSASGFAALTLAASTALQLQSTTAQLSEWARIGSGSAARSIFGGFAEMALGSKNDGSDSVARPLFEASHWPLEVFILVTSAVEKPIGSTDGMNLTRDTSPYYQSWVSTADNDINTAREAIKQRDFDKLALVSEFSCLKMHGLAMSANPGILYWNGQTVDLIHEVRRLRLQGLRIFFTIDAGPQVKVICHPDDAGKAGDVLRDLPGVRQMLHSKLGKGAQIVSQQTSNSL